MKTNILYIYERMMPTVATLRSEMKELFNEGPYEINFKSVVDVSNDDLSKASSVIAVRPENSLSYRLLKNAKKRGSYVASFCDDDLLNLPSNLPRIPWRKYFLKKSLSISQIIISSSPYICEKYSKLTEDDKWFICHTTVPEETINNIPLKPSNNDVVKIVYAAGRDHVDLFNKYILPILPELGKKYKDRISLTMVGVQPDIDECNKYVNTEYVDGMPLEQYRQYMRNAHFDIGLAPLNDTPFNRCKYFNKFIEYTIVGVTGLYSNTIPYSYVIKDRINGRLVGEDPKDWLDAISECVEDTEYREKSLQGAIDYLKDKHNKARALENFKIGVKELFEERKTKIVNAPIPLYKMEYSIQRVADLTYMSLFTIRKEGIRSMLQKALTHSKEIKKMAE